MPKKATSSKRILPFAIILLVLLVAGGAAWAMWRGAQERPQTNSAAKSSANGVGASSTASSSSSPAITGATPPHAKGDERAPVTLEEFADLQCPSCAVTHKDLQKILGEYGPQRVRLIFRHYPLVQLHRNALAAAVATEAAARQNKFWEMQDQLYRNQKAWSEEADPRQIFYDYARTLGLNADRFMQDMRDPLGLQRVKADTARGNALGITGTPTLYLNGRQLTVSEATENGLRVALDAALRTAGK